MADSKVLPIAKSKFGTMSIAIFSNETGNSWNIQKSYKPKDSELWKSSKISLFQKELDNLKKCIADIESQLAKKK